MLSASDVQSVYADFVWKPRHVVHLSNTIFLSSSCIVPFDDLNFKFFSCHLHVLYHLMVQVLFSSSVFLIEMHMSSEHLGRRKINNSFAFSYFCYFCPLYRFRKVFLSKDMTPRILSCKPLIESDNLSLAEDLLTLHYKNHVYQIVT